MSFRAAIITMVYNENYFLPLWCAYYGRQVGMDNLYVIDHGSTDGSTDALPCNRLRIPRDCFDDGQRAAMISRLHASLLSFFDVVIYVDCDEFLVPRTDLFASLPDYLEKHRNHSVIRAVGVDVFPERPNMPAVNTSRPLLEQRSFGFINPWESKPVISYVPISWAPGFHECDQPSYLDLDLWLFHMKNMDLDISLKRLALTRALNWSKASVQNGQGAHQRCSDEELINKFQHLMNRKRNIGLDSLPINEILSKGRTSDICQIPEQFISF
ncbi:hypothetical protein B0W47_09425 [Komagataeibacter nataicola]|uniref:Glycosyltransferase family 2 protein n=2 Tax=Komagataeibacter nataicola TaxID=265960 RepID=A0A9N7C8D8_9PROT|nr:glycosyltransferase family 2 protein [Komagataeibacter nataicola]AQU87656.1 hypothetical protein B0W47_09425 [Komagataeibacter nataicola]PYD65401.1 hypothetical protein CDI09_13645 [Komagataeibacter nataicola]WNM09733.1 glycosyltransferase family 2 protein [Komagataeibacter nataicola]